MINKPLEKSNSSKDNTKPYLALILYQKKVYTDLIFQVWQSRSKYVLTGTWIDWLN